jgi:hypothetical protein
MTLFFFFRAKDRSRTMKLALAFTSLAIATFSTDAFAPLLSQSSSARLSSSLNSLNGWTPDESKFAYGLPGSLAPAADFDPLGFAADADLEKIKYYREAEVQHGRVASMYIVCQIRSRMPPNIPRTHNVPICTIYSVGFAWLYCYWYVIISSVSEIIPANSHPLFHHQTCRGPNRVPPLV